MDALTNFCRITIYSQDLLKIPSSFILVNEYRWQRNIVRVVVIFDLRSHYNRCFMRSGNELKGV